MKYRDKLLSELLKKNNIEIIDIDKLKKAKIIKIKYTNGNFECNSAPREFPQSDDPKPRHQNKPKKKPKHKHKNRTKAVKKNKRNNFIYK